MIKLTVAPKILTVRKNLTSAGTKLTWVIFFKLFVDVKLILCLHSALSSEANDYVLWTLQILVQGMTARRATP